MEQTEMEKLLAEEGLEACAPLPLSLTRILRPYLIGRLPFTPKTALLFLVPYYAGACENLARYAAAGDYHVYMQGLFARLAPRLARHFPSFQFAGFSDHSPIDERHAAALAGLGMLGEHGLIIHPRYGSFVFIGELLTDAPASLFGFRGPAPILRCEGCGACRRVCPTGILRGERGECLSAITQKKGKLEEGEAALLRHTGAVWGCDVCQLACPHNRRAIESGSAVTPIPFFREGRITRLTRAALDAMDAPTFSARAFSFRGRAPLIRNLAILEGEGEAAPPAPPTT